MESAGNEKRIQTLFCELKSEDERLAPGFVKLWNRAQLTTSRPLRAFKISFAAATALVVITVCSLAFWSRNRERAQQAEPGVAIQSAIPGPTTTPPPAIRQPKQLVVAGLSDRIRSIRWSRKLAARRQAELTARNAAIREAIAISSWQAPTATLMQSPADDLLTTLPQLDRSVTELNSFLPHSQK